MIQVLPVLYDKEALLHHATDVLVFTSFCNLPLGRGIESADRLFNGAISRAAASVGCDFTGRLGQQMLLRLQSPGGPQHLMVCGLGRRNHFTLDALYKVMAVMTDTAHLLDFYKVSIPVSHVEATGLRFVDICGLLSIIQEEVYDELILEVLCTRQAARELPRHYAVRW